MKKILLATDFSERSDRALRRATLLARQFGASLAIVHVVDDDQPRRIVDSERDAASALLRELKDTLQNIDGISCETRVILADPFAGIARAAEEEAPDLLVIGPHRRQALRDVFVGTTAERAIRSVTCPVLMVNAPPVGSYRHVMLATDLSEGARRAAQITSDLGLLEDPITSMLHVFDAHNTHFSMTKEQREAYIADERSEASRQLSAFAKSAGLDMITRTVRLDETATANEILQAAQETSADLVVVGTHGRTAFARFFLGSVAEAVLRIADRDILAVPPDKAA